MPASWSRWQPSVADASRGHDLVASFFTRTGAGFGEEPRHSFAQRCRAAAAAGFTGIGLHADDLPRTIASGLDVAGMQAVPADTGLRVVEIEFLGGWALDADPAELEDLVRRIEAVADAFGGRHVSAGEFRGGAELDLDTAAARLDRLGCVTGRAGPAGRGGGVPLVGVGRPHHRARAAAQGRGAERRPVDRRLAAGVCPANSAAAVDRASPRARRRVARRRHGHVAALGTARAQRIRPEPIRAHQLTS
jgi:hypothetical protein